MLNYFGKKATLPNRKIERFEVLQKFILLSKSVEISHQLNLTSTICKEKNNKERKKYLTKKYKSQRYNCTPLSFEGDAIVKNVSFCCFLFLWNLICFSVF